MSLWEVGVSAVYTWLGGGSGCPVPVNSFRHGCLRPLSPVAWGCVSPIDWCPRRSVVCHRADAECTFRCLRWVVCDALRRMMCPTRGVPLFSIQLVRHVVRSQGGDKSGVGAATTDVLLLFYLIIIHVSTHVVPTLDCDFGVPRASAPQILGSVLNFSVLPGSRCVTPVAGLLMVAGPAQGRPGRDQLVVSCGPNRMRAA